MTAKMYQRAKADITGQLRGLKTWQSNAWFCRRFSFFIKTSFVVVTESWYCVIKAAA